MACALIWGTTWYAIRVSRAGFPLFDAVALRFAVAALILIPLALRARPWPKGRAWSYLVLAGVLDAASYMLVYMGEDHVPGGVAAVLYGTQPLILALLLAGTRMEPLTRKHVVGAIVSLAGVGVLAIDRFDVSPDQALGVLLVLGSVVVSTIYSMLMKRHGEGVSSLVATSTEPITSPTPTACCIDTSRRSRTSTATPASETSAPRMCRRVIASMPVARRSAARISGCVP
jgi:drug/metabolite transporter (DMT)-like permease